MTDKKDRNTERKADIKTDIKIKDRQSDRQKDREKDWEKKTEIQKKGETGKRPKEYRQEDREWGKLK